MREDKRKRKNSGFTLVEVLIAVAILAVISIPVLQSFVSVAQVNSKSRRRLTATTIAENLMESCKGIPLKEVAAQCNSSLPSSHKVSLTIVDSGTAMEVDITNIENPSSSKTVNWSDTDGYTFTAKDDGYAFYIHNIVSGGAKYDAIIKYELDTTRNKDSSGTVEDTMRSAGLNVLKYYNVTIDVYRASADLSSLKASKALVTIEGSVADYSN